MLLATVTWMLTMWRQTSCIQTDPASYPQTFHKFCYTDISVLYLNRGLSEGKIPLVDVPLEYPVLTTWVMEIARQGVNVFGGYSGPGVSALEAVRGAELFYAITAVIMFLCFLGAVWMHLRLHRPWDAMMLAASPLVVMGGLINWDMLVVLLASASVLAWSRRRAVLAGVLLGLAVAAKLYPVFWLLPLLFLCVRSGKLREFTRFSWGALASWLAINIPAYFISPQNWLMFWTFNVDRDADLGSIWYVLRLAQIEVTQVSSWMVLLFGVAGIAIALLILLAPRRPRLGQVLFLIIVAFLVVNKVYSPQYMLWLLPLLVLARPNWRDWLTLTIAEGLYWAAIWGHLAQTMLPGDSTSDRVYWAAVLLRIGVELFLAGKVVRDIWYPQHDPVRAGGPTLLDDPDGGILDGAPDVPLIARLQRQLGLAHWPEPTTAPVAPDDLALATVLPGVPAPQTPAHQTPAPEPEPRTSAPQAPEPQTPTHQTPEPEAGPQTSALEAEPQTPALEAGPQTSTPQTPEPQTPAPQTSALEAGPQTPALEAGPQTSTHQTPEPEPDAGAAPGPTRPAEDS